MYGVKENWFAYRLQITTLARYLRLLLNATSTSSFTKEEVDQKLRNNHILNVLYKWFKYCEEEPDVNLKAEYPDQLIQDEYLVCDAMDDDVQVIAQQATDYENCIPLEEWIKFLDVIPVNVVEDELHELELKYDWNPPMRRKKEKNTRDVKSTVKKSDLEEYKKKLQQKRVTEWNDKRSKIVQEKRFPTDKMTEEAQRDMIYQDYHPDMIQFRAEIQRLAQHIRVLIDDPPSNLNEKLEKNPFTKILYDYFQDMKNVPDFVSFVELYFSAKIIDEFTVLEGIRETCKDGTNKSAEDWNPILTKARKKIEDDPDGKRLRKYNLGSELHTFPADASRELTISNLTRRLETFQEW